CARGYLVRNEIRRAREDFEGIVRQIDGGLTHIRWREAVIPIPHFTDTSPSTSSSAAAAALSEDRGDHSGLPEKIEAERDDSQAKGGASLSRHFPNSGVRGDGEGLTESPVGDKDGGLMESTGDSTTAWSSLELDMNCGHTHKGVRQYCLAQEVPCTPQALRLHRNTLTMELLWLQQAIDSRKKVRWRKGEMNCFPTFIQQWQSPACLWIVTVTAGSEMAAGTAAITHLPPVKSVVVYRNGDPFYSGRRFVVNQRQVATMEAFLTEVTQSIGAPLAIRTLYTPRQGHRVSELQELQTGAQYVAAGFEKFKKLDYLHTGTKKQPAAREEAQAKVTQRPNVSAKWRRFIPVPCIIHVFRNGDLLCPPFRFIIPRTMRQDLEQILSLVTEKVSLRTGAVRRLCSLEGVTVSSAVELETGRSYVAVGTERFKKLPYEELLVSKAAERYYPGKRRLQRRNENWKAGSGPEDQYSDSALLDSPESDSRRVKSTGDEAVATKQRSRRDGADEASAFFARPVKIRNNRRQPRPPLSNGSVQPSVFKRAARRREEVRGAEEVREDENTATELPVDQRVAEVVEDEELTNQNDHLHNTQQVGRDQHFFFPSSFI
ncbi:hypothetical protein L3Q82_026488, partial [Scortum barcoo]